MILVGDTYGEVCLGHKTTLPVKIDHLIAVTEAVRRGLLEMSAKLENMIAAEIGVDDGRELPDVDGIDWVLQKDRFD